MHDSNAETNDMARQLIVEVRAASQALIDERLAASTQRQILLDTIEAERASAQQQRLILLHKVELENSEASRQRAMMMDEMRAERADASVQRLHMKQQLDGITSMIQGTPGNPIVVGSLSPAATQHAQQAYSTSTSTTSVSRPRAIPATTVEEEERRTMLNTHRGVSDVYDWLPASAVGGVH